MQPGPLSEAFVPIMEKRALSLSSSARCCDGSGLASSTSASCTLDKS